MSPSEWVHSDFAIRKSKRSYAHFDFRTDLSKCSDYITSPEKVATHAFYPFIHYTIEFEKYSKDKGKKIKKREICYASHIDRCIYQYYNHLLDEMYIKRVHEIDISDSVVAYRSERITSIFLTTLFLSSKKCAVLYHDWRFHKLLR